MIPIRSREVGVAAHADPEEFPASVLDERRTFIANVKLPDPSKESGSPKSA